MGGSLSARGRAMLIDGCLREVGGEPRAWKGCCLDDVGPALRTWSEACLSKREEKGETLQGHAALM